MVLRQSYQKPTQSFPTIFADAIVVEEGWHIYISFRRMLMASHLNMFCY